MIDKQQGQAETKIESFDGFGLKDDVLRGIYSYGIEKPASIQSQIIPTILKGKDTIIQDQPGTGKTTACAISILQLVDLEVRECQALIIAPTYELARNIQLVTLCLGNFLKILVCESHELQKGAQVVVGSAKTVDEMIQKGTLKVDHLKICVFDEIDEIIARGFKDQIQEIFERFQKKVQTVLIQYKTTPEIEGFIKDFMKDPETVSVKTKEMTLENIKQFYVALEKEEWKIDTLIDLLGSIEFRKCLLYCNQKKTALGLTEKLKEKAFNTSEINNEMDERQRVATLEDFKNGALTILLVTGSLTRDVDLQEIPLVINYDFPLNAEQYLQRVGRSEKLEKKLVVVNFTTPMETQMMLQIEKYYNTEIVELPLDLSKIFE